MSDDKKSFLKSLFSWRLQAQDPPPNSSPTDSFAQKIVAYIPADILAAYLTLTGMISQVSTAPAWLAWAVFGGLLALIPFYVCYIKTSPASFSSRKLFHWITSCVAYTAWCFAMGGPFAREAWYQPIYGSVILVFVTLIIPVLERFFVKPPSNPATPPSGGNASS
jgi:hypothetical protein